MTAQAPFLVEDVRTTGVNIPNINFAHPLEFLELDGVLYFTSDDEVHGRELWRTDGTEEGTWIVKDVCPGHCHGRSGAYRHAVSNGLLFFVAQDAVHGDELWVSDGTAEGTEMVADIWPGMRNSFPGLLTDVDGTLFFVADDGVHGDELWRSDGTAAGTEMVADIASGAVSGVDGGDAGLVAVGSDLFFSADDGEHGLELWISDGTESGTQMVQDIRPGAADGVEAEDDFPNRPYHRAALGSMLVFTATTDGSDHELWASDGTESGTVQIASVMDASFFEEHNGSLYFRADDGVHGRELWRTDGTSAGTSMVADVQSGGSFDESNPSPLASNGSHLLFTADDGVNGRELWRTDGTGSGTEMVADIDPGPDGGANFVSFGFIPAVRGSEILFHADDGTHGREWWISDGTASGTSLVADIAPGGDDGALHPVFWPLYPATLGTDFVFNAYDDSVGWETRISDGTPSGTSLVRDIHRQVSSVPTIEFWGVFAEAGAAGGFAYVGLEDGVHGGEPWRTDGTPEGTFLLQDLNPDDGDEVPGEHDGSFPYGFVGVGERVFFFGQSRNPSGDDQDYLVTSDGTPGGTEVLAEFGDVGLGVGIPFDGRYHFRVSDELWQSDGTPGGTIETADVRPVEFAAAASVFYLDDTSGELWRSDGTAPGTIPVAVFPSTGDCAGPSSLATAPGDVVYFAASDGVAGCELWVSDGTGSGTEMVADVNPGPSSSMPHPLGIDPTEPGFDPFDEPTAIVTLGSQAVFIADDRVSGTEIWTSDGTEAGTVRLRDILPGPEGSNPRRLTTAGGLGYFEASDGASGRELWRTDGTPAGTFRVRDIDPGPGSATPFALTAVDGRLYFSAADGAGDVELWRSDGSEAGTVRVADINPSGSSSPQDLTFACPNLYFTATDGATGFEPWALPIHQGIDLVLSNRRVATTEQQTACDSILIHDGFVVEDGGDLTLRAGERVVLGDGFSVLAGARLTAEVDPGVVDGSD